jgi:hypothetical protein
MPWATTLSSDSGSKPSSRTSLGADQLGVGGVEQPDRVGEIIEDRDGVADPRRRHHVRGVGGDEAQRRIADRAARRPGRSLGPARHRQHRDERKRAT